QWKAEIARLEATLRTPTPEVEAGRSKWEKAFPLDLKWQTPRPGTAKSQSGSAVTVDEDGSVHVAAGAKNDTYTVQGPLEGSTLRALRLEALPDAKLPGNGPGHADGHFLVTRVAAAVTPPREQPLAGRFVRIEIPGKQKILSLAEVQVFRGNDNVALKGE